MPDRRRNDIMTGLHDIITIFKSNLYNRLQYTIFAS